MFIINTKLQMRLLFPKVMNMAIYKINLETLNKDYNFSDYFQLFWWIVLNIHTMISLCKDIMNALRNIIVTGSNKGIGFGIVENLAGKVGWNIIMAVRNIQLGQKSKEEITAKHPHASIHLEKLDVSDFKSIQEFVGLVKQKYGKIDVLVNNAGVAAKGDAFDTDVVKFTFQTNFYGTIELTERILPYISDNGKIITLGSTAAVMTFKKITNEGLKERFKKPNLTKEELFGLLHEFEAGVQNNTYAEQGWPKWSYGVSKLGINLYHPILGRNEDVVKRHIQVNVCCPGYVKTDMTSHKGHLSLEEGIKTPIYLIERPFEYRQEDQGNFYYLEKVTSFFE